MLIKNITIYILRNKKNFKKIPLPNFYNKGFIFFKIETKEGVYGFGEPNPYLGSHGIIEKKIINLYIKYFKNKKINAINLNFLKKKIKGNLEKSLISSFQQALFDIHGKYLGKSVSQLLSKNDKSSSKLDLYASGGSIFENKSYDYLLDEAISFKEEGFVGWKFRPKMPLSNLSHQLRINKPPNFNIREVLSFSNKLRKSVGEKFHLMFDAGCRCKNIKEAKFLIEGLKDLNFLFIEEPIKRNLNKYISLKKELDKKIDIGAGENFHDYYEFINWIKFDCIDILQPDSNLLLYDELYKIFKLTKKRNKSLIFHNWCNPINVCSNFSFISSLNQNLITEYNVVINDFYDQFNINCFKIRKGKANIIKAPGLGVDLKKNKNNNFLLYEKKV